MVSGCQFIHCKTFLIYKNPHSNLQELPRKLQADKFRFVGETRKVAHGNAQCLVTTVVLVKYRQGNTFETQLGFFSYGNPIFFGHVWY